jgi:hypothetical protein
MESGGRKAPWARWVGALADAWRERASERRASAAPRAVRAGREARSRLISAVEARLAVRAGVRLDDFLRGRLAKYAASLPVTLEELPVAIDVQGGEAVVRSRSRSSWTSSRPSPAQAPALARALVAREGPYAEREILDAESALDALDARATAARARIDELGAELSEAIASGALAARPDVVATAEQLGRPTVPTLAPIAALRAFVAALWAGLAWRFAAPVLAACGIHAASPEAAVAAAPVPAALALVLALGAAAAALAFAGVALSRAADAIDEAAAPRRRVALALGACGSAAGTAAVAAAATSSDRPLQLALLVTLPFAGALLWRWSARLQRVRAGALDAALAWDRDRTREGVERGRRIEALEAERSALVAIEAERDRARRRLRALHRRAVDADRHAGFAARAEARNLDRLAEGLASALELDRYLYIRLAAERDTALLPRPARPTRVGAAVATDSLGMAG